MTKINMNRICPTCKSQVYGFRHTKRYCNDTCRARHHYLARKQLDLRLSKEKLENYYQLVTRNFYLAEGLIGEQYSKVAVPLKVLKMHKFQFSEYFEKVEDDGINKYKICNYHYWQVGAVVHIERIADGPQFNDSVSERWLSEFPDYANSYKMNSEKRRKFKKFLLANGQVWRE